MNGLAGEENRSLFEESSGKETSLEEEFGLKEREPRIFVVGVGGAGNNAVTRLSGMGIQGARTIAMNTDVKHLHISKADQRMLLGRDLTKGLGCGGFPDLGAKAAEESEWEVKKALAGCDMVYIVLGLGGGTGTGAAPVIARIAKEMGAIVIANATMPFRIEGSRMRKAEDGLYELRQHCDTVCVIENDRLLNIAGDLPIQQAFFVADNLIATMIKGITETISTPSLVNLDYADVRTIMHSGGVAAVGFAESHSDHRAEEAVTKAMNHPLLEVDYEGGKGALIHVTGGEDLRLEEVNLIGEHVSKRLDPEAQVIWGARIDQKFKGKIRVITLVTGIKSPYIMGPVGSEPEQQKEEIRNYADEMGIRILR